MSVSAREEPNSSVVSMVHRGSNWNRMGWGKDITVSAWQQTQAQSLSDGDVPESESAARRDSEGCPQ